MPMFDRSLPSHIKKYVEEHSFVDIVTMAEDLQKQYRNDYGRRKRNMFRKLVSQVHQEMLDTGQLLQHQPKRKKTKHKSSVDDDSSDPSNDEMKQYVEYKNTNMMNQSVASMYNKSNDDAAQKLTPSRIPQQFQSAENASPEDEEKLGTKTLGWYIDYGPNNKRIARPCIDINPTNNPDDESNKIESKCEDNTTSQTANPLDDFKTENKASSNLYNGTEHLETTIESSSKKRSKRKDQSNGKRTKKRITKQDKKSDEVDDFTPPGRKTFTLQEVDATFSDIAGNHDSLQELARLLLHMSHPEIYTTLGVSPPRGVLLHGPPGCGKTLLGNAVAGQLQLPILRLVGPELIGGVSGESEKRVRDVFETAIDNAPCVLFLDEIDAVAQRRDSSSKDMERRIVAQLLSCLDDLNKDSHQVMVIGATNRPDSLDPALRRAGRFDREIRLGIPDEKARKQILEVLCKKLKLAEDISFSLIARLTPGYVGADLLSLCREAAMRAVTRILGLDAAERENLTGPRDILEWLRDPQPFAEEQLEKLSIETKDFELAVLDVQPSAKREGFATVPGVTWEDVGALEHVREELSIAILGPVRNPSAFAALGLSRASGVLLAGPPGCGKTLLAKAIANESGINFVSVKGPELLNMYVGESERAVRQCFERARNSSPCVIFFDELDSLCPRRSSIEAGSTARVVNQMLTELDGLESRKQVFVVAATNRPDIIDPAVLRPGRLDKTLYVGIPSSEDRAKILETITKNGSKPPLAEGVNLRELAMDTRCDGFTGADLSALVREAALNAIRGSIKHEWNVILPDDESGGAAVDVTSQNFDDAFSKVCPSISETDRKMYEDMRNKLKRS